MSDNIYKFKYHKNGDIKSKTPYENGKIHGLK